MTIAVFWFVIFITVASILVAVQHRNNKKRVTARLHEVTAPRSYHDVLMDRYHCEMTAEEVAMLNGDKWHD